MTISEIKFKYDNLRPLRSGIIESNHKRLDSYIEEIKKYG